MEYGLYWFHHFSLAALKSVMAKRRWSKKSLAVFDRSEINEDFPFSLELVVEGSLREHDSSNDHGSLAMMLVIALTSIVDLW